MSAAIGVKWVDDAIRRLADQGKKATTRASYESNLRGMRGTWFEDEKRFLGVNLRDFKIFIALMDAMGGAASARTVEATRAAVRNAMTTTGEYQDPTLNAQIDAAVKGYGQEHPQGAVDYGPIDWEKMQQLEQFMLSDEKTDVDTYWGALSQWTFALRVSQVKGMRMCDLRRRADGLLEYSCRRQKGRSVKKDNEVEYHEGARQSLPFMNRLLALSARDGPKAVLQSTFTMEKLNDTIRRAAAHFKWDPCLQWSSHSLRHGSLVQARRDGGLDAVYRRGAQLSGATRELYSREETQRKGGEPGRKRKDGARARAAKVAKLAGSTKRFAKKSITKRGGTKIFS